MVVSDRPPLTDSPWFWVLLFSLMALVALATISGQYGKRQSRLERQYQARERVVAGDIADPARQAYSTAERTLIPIWPVAVVLGLVAMFAAAMLYRLVRNPPDELSG